MSFALVIEPDSEAASAVADTLGRHRLNCVVAQSGEESWRLLATRKPDLVLAELSTTGIDVFFRRLRDEYMGSRPRLVATADPNDLGPEVHGYDLDAVIFKPVAGTTLSALLRPSTGSAGSVVKLSGGRLRELLRLSCLGNELQSDLDAVASRLVLVYGVAKCVLLANASERQWVGSSGDPIPAEEWPDLWERCELAVSAGAPIIVQSDHGLETRFAAAIRAANGAVIGAICLFAEGACLFTQDARQALLDLAHRLGREISWRSVHERVAAERDQLRDNAMLDPMLGILSRAALDHTATVEVSRAQRSSEPLSIALLDITGLRHINDRYGHVIGDAALKHVANLIRRQIRGQDVVARWGGDEMAIVLPGTGMRGASSFLQRLRKEIEASPFQVGTDGIELKVAIGLAEFRKDDDSGRLLARAASSAINARQQGVAISIGEDANADDMNAATRLDRFIAGTRLAGMYQIAHEISRGAMGVVYRAEDLGLSRPVAIKMLRPDLVNDRELVERFRAEAGVLAALDHDNLVRVYAFVEDKDDVFFVMELVEGVSLDDIISDALEEGSYLPAPRVCEVIKQVAGALDKMHDAGLMHRDVKPGNVVLDRARNRAVLVDVGLAKRMGDKTKPAGTPGFIAPESFRGGAESPATDVYGLAATAYSLLTGRAPFGRAENYKEILQRQLDERPPAPTTFRNDLPAGVDEVVLRGLAVEARDRPATAGAFATGLLQALSKAAEEPTLPEQPAPAVQAEQPKEEARKPRKRPLTTKPLDEKPRTLTLNLEMIPPGGSNQSEPMTRGVVFRGAASLLGDHLSVLATNTGPSVGGLRDALSLRTSPLSWLGAELFLQLMEYVAHIGRDPEAFAKQLAAMVVDESFERFYPSSPESLTPKATLSAADILWRRYHTWGKLTVNRVATRTASFAFEGPDKLGVHAFIEGWLESIATRSGGKNPRVKKQLLGEKQAEFQVYWGA